MTDPTTPTGNPGTEPTVPLVPDGGYSQPAVPTLEPTRVEDLFASGYPDFSYDGAGSTTAIPTIDPNPLPAAANYAQPSVPAATQYADPAPNVGYGYTEPNGTAPHAATGVQYQSYPGTAVAQFHDPVSYDYGYARQPQIDHPNAVVSLILGIVGLVFFPLASPIGLFLANKGRREVAAFPGRWATGGTLTAGWVISLIGTILWGLIIGFILLAIVGIGVLATTGG